MLRQRFVQFVVLCLWLSSCGSPTVKAGPGVSTVAPQPEATVTLEASADQGIPSRTAFFETPTSTFLSPENNSILPTATSVLTSSLQLEKASLDSPPAFPADMLYLSDGKLMRWDYRSDQPVLFTSQFEVIDSSEHDNSLGARTQILDYAVDGSQRWIALLVAHGITANGVGLHDIDLLDLDTGRQTKLTENIRRSSLLNFSPDGWWLTYQTQDGNSHHFMIANLLASEPVNLGECFPEEGTECETVVWSPDSRKLLWSDLNGIWYYDLGSHQAVNLLGNKLQAQDGSGNVQELPVEYRQLEWSPQGRFATVAIQSKTFDRSWAALLDTRTGRLVEVPDTYKANNPSGTVTWLKDGRLLMANGEYTPGDPARLVIWRVLAAHENLLVLDEVVRLDSFYAAEDKSRLPAHGVSSIDHVSLLDSRSLCMVLRFVQAEKPPTLYCLDLKYRLFRRFGEVPHDLTNLVFSPDNNSVIMIGSHGSTLYVPSGQDIYLDIHPLFGDNPAHITWLNRPVAGNPNQ